MNELASKVGKRLKYDDGVNPWHCCAIQALHCVLVISGRYMYFNSKLALTTALTPSEINTSNNTNSSGKSQPDSRMRQSQIG
jgi:hypothetical protein